MANGRRQPLSSSEMPALVALPTPGSPNSGENFEGALKRLNTIVEQLETGELLLEDSLALFEEGVKLVRAAQTKLDSAEKRVEELLATDEFGNPVVRELEVE